MIREANGQDAKAIAHIYNHYIEHDIATFEEDPITPLEMESRIQKVKVSQLPWLVAIEEDTVVGYAYAKKWHERSAYRFTVESSVYLSPASTSRGRGTQLYAALFDILKNQKIRVAIGVISLPNPASAALHEKFGMEKVAHLKEVGYKFGKWVDVGYWQKRIRR